MPRAEDIERFTQVLNSLGDEPAIRAARSESIGEVPTPAEGASPQAPDELDSLNLGDEDTGGGSPGEAESLQDIFSSLSALPDEGTEEPGSGGGETPGGAEPEGFGPAEAPAQEPGAAEEGLDFDSLFGEQAAPEGIEDLDPGNLQADLAEMETLPDELAQGGLDIEAQPEAAAPEMETPDEGGGAFGDLDAFSADSPPTADSLEDFTAPGFETPQQGGSAAEESFELPSLDDVSFSEPVDGLPADTAPLPSEEPSFDAPLPSFDEPTPSVEEPSLEGMSFEEPSIEEAAPPETGESGSPGFDLGPMDEFPAEPSAGGPAAPGEAMPEEAGMESLGEESLGDLNLDEFSLPASAEQFGMPAAPIEAPPARPAPAGRAREKAGPAEPRPRPQPRRPSPEPGIGEGEVELTPEQFAQLKRVLESLPRNLKIVVQDLIGEGTASGPDLAALLTLLLRGAAAQEIATLAGRISGKRIRIPTGYEKKTGLAFEAEQRTFAYAFRENFLPLVRVVVITLVAGGLFGFLGYNYVFRPLSAYTNYRAGYAQIANDRYALANEKFARATRIWPLKRWYYRYAEGFEAKRQYLLAEHKYDELLKAYPGDRKGTLDYARMESERLADYEKADSLLKGFLDAHHDDYDGLLASGDNDLRWAERDRGKLESARLAYATLIDTYGARDVLLFRMLRYFIRSDNGEEVERLRAFYATKPDVKIDASVFAEMGGYLIDHRRLDWVQEVLFRADKAQPGLYEVHYNLARYYRIVKNVVDEKKALDATVKLLDLTRDTDAVTRRRLTVEIDTHTRLGEYYYAAQEYLPAEKELQTAIRLIENNQRMKLIGNDRIFGRPYAVLGDLYYTIQGDLQSASVQYGKAIENHYTDPELTYKIGYIQYAQKDYKGALDSFTNAEDATAYPTGNEALAPAAEPSSPSLPLPPGQPPQNLLYAIGNTFFQRGDYFAAQAYYLRMLDRLQTRKAALGILHPEDRPDDLALLETMVKVNNNLGVTMFRLAERTGDRKKRSEAMVYLSAGAEIAGALARSPDTVRRSEDRSLPSLNMHAILYPLSGFELEAYTLLPKDFEATDW